MKQYLGGHDETWGRVTINIDRNFLNLGKPGARAESHCGGVDVDLADYPRTRAGSDPALVKALQCLLHEQKAYAGKVTGTFSAKTLAAVQDWQRGARPRGALLLLAVAAWMTLLATGPQPVLKRGSTGPAVRRVQRALNAATPGTELQVGGVFNERDRPRRCGRGRRRRDRRRGGREPQGWAALTSATRS